MTTRKMNLYVISEIRDCLDLFSAPMARKNLNAQFQKSDRENGGTCNNVNILQFTLQESEGKLP